jgi:signal transduction histidine kinase
MPNGPLILTAALLLAGLLIAGWRMRNHRRLLKTKMAGPDSAAAGGARSVFFWQAVLILLPVGIMTILALASVFKERMEVEREVQRRAQEFMEGILSGLDQRAGMELWSWECHQDAQRRESRIGSLWIDERTEALKALRREPVGSTTIRKIQVFPPRFEHETLALLRSSGGPLPDLIFEGNGRLVEPDERFRFPVPPAWRVELSPEQSAAWDALLRQSATAGGDGLAPVLERFLKTSPPPHAQAAAEFIRLTTRTSSGPPPTARRRLEFADACRGIDNTNGIDFHVGDDWCDAVSESGIPLSTLAVIEALRVAGRQGFSDQHWDGVLQEVRRHPGFLTDALLDAVEPMTRGNPAASSLASLRQEWMETQQRWAMADALRQGGRLRANTTNSFWIDSYDGRRLCFMQPVGSNQNSSASAPLIAVQTFPKSAVEYAFSSTFNASQAAELGSFYHLTVELEGEPLTLVFGKLAITGQPTETLVASGDGRLTCPERPGSAGTSVPVAGAPVEAFPSRPRFSMRLYLADRDEAYAGYRRRVLMMAGLIIGSALAAVVGLIAARRAFRRQVDLNTAKSNFVSSVSHELRAPIASVRLMAESLERGAIHDSGRQKEYFHLMGQECRRLSALIANVLDFARIEQGRKQYEFEPTDMVALVRSTVTLMEPYAAEKSVKLVLETSPSTPCRRRGDETHSQPGALSTERGVGGEKLESPDVVSCIEFNVDGRAIQQALVNLIDNAIKHTRSGQTVEVGMKMRDATGANGGEAGPRLCIFVADSGPGIPAEDHERIFERFYRRGSELRRETQGVGIGLSIVKHIVEAHGGRILLESAPGRGSRFTIELPQTSPSTH